MIRRAALIAATLLAGCTAAPVSEMPTRGRIAESSLPPMRSFAATRPRLSLKEYDVDEEDWEDFVIGEDV